jgi:spore maturation protein CgeB
VKILCVDKKLVGQKNADWKEGFEFYYAFNKLGYHCDIAGKHCDIPETEIPKIAKNYDLIIISENYPEDTHWEWWDWGSIKTPKLFWAIDTHIKDFRKWIRRSNIDYVAFNNRRDMHKYNLNNSFWMPYGASSRHHLITYTENKTKNVVFIGGMLPERKRLCEKHNIENLQAYGADYILNMQSSKICFNLSMAYDINAKYFEIMASGSFMLTNFNEDFFKYMDCDDYLSKCFYNTDDELRDKIDYYLNNDLEREEIAATLKKIVSTNHTYENRANLILNEISLLNVRKPSFFKRFLNLEK